MVALHLSFHPYASTHPTCWYAGSLAIPLALRGANVCASDISAAMVSEAAARCVCLYGTQPGCVGWVKNLSVTAPLHIL